MKKRYMIPSEYPADDYAWGPYEALANWTSDPNYAYQMFARSNPQPIMSFVAWQQAVERAKQRRDRVSLAALRQMAQTPGMIGPRPSARQNPLAPNPFEGRAKLYRQIDNAGPYLPQIYPYGQGGRPATYAVGALSNPQPGGLHIVYDKKDAPKVRRMMRYFENEPEVQLSLRDAGPNEIVLNVRPTSPHDPRLMGRFLPPRIEERIRGVLRDLQLKPVGTYNVPQADPPSKSNPVVLKDYQMFDRKHVGFFRRVQELLKKVFPEQDLIVKPSGKHVKVGFKKLHAPSQRAFAQELAFHGIKPKRSSTRRNPRASADAIWVDPEYKNAKPIRSEEEYCAIRAKANCSKHPEVGYYTTYGTKKLKALENTDPLAKWELNYRTRRGGGRNGFKL